MSRNDRLLSAGTDSFDGDAFLLFWDIRNPKLLGGYWESHTDDITEVSDTETLSKYFKEGRSKIQKLLDAFFFSHS